MLRVNLRLQDDLALLQRIQIRVIRELLLQEYHVFGDRIILQDQCVLLLHRGYNEHRLLEFLSLEVNLLLLNHLASNYDCSDKHPSFEHLDLLRLILRKSYVPCLAVRFYTVDQI